jgi:mitochondrial enoyl-[acyl-carrier protein] reductase / trans-2-enoyl-CoA reductase
MPQAILQSNSNPSSLAVSHFDLPETPPADKIIVKFHASSINPLDIAVLRGAYPVKPRHLHDDCSIPGFDGVASILSVGSSVSDNSLAPGDIVVPKDYGLGTWRSHAILDPSEVQKIPRPDDIMAAAVLKLGIVPAYLLVYDLVALKPGEWILLNAGTSVIAQFVVQFAKRKGVKVANVIRERSKEEETEVKKALIALGADMVVTEAELEGDMTKLEGKNIVLALDSVFGKSGQLLLRSLAVGGTFVQLGMLGGPTGKLELSAAHLFARRITLRGFRGSAQWGVRSSAEQRDLLASLVGLCNSGELILPTLGLEKVIWDTENAKENGKEVLEVLEKVQKGGLGQRKVVMIFQ